jgi:hypothetical protein
LLVIHHFDSFWLVSSLPFVFHFFLLKHQSFVMLGPQDLEFRVSAEAAERSEPGRLAAAAQTLAAGGSVAARDVVLDRMSLCLRVLLDVWSLFAPKLWRFSSSLNFWGDPKSK